MKMTTVMGGSRRTVKPFTRGGISVGCKDVFFGVGNLSSWRVLLTGVKSASHLSVL